MYFLNYSFKFQPNIYNTCHDLLMMSIKLSDIAIINIKRSDYSCIVSLISKTEAIKFKQNADLTGKYWNIKEVENYKSKKSIKIFESIYKNVKNYKIWWFHQHKETISIKKQILIS